MAKKSKEEKEQEKAKSKKEKKAPSKEPKKKGKKGADAGQAGEGKIVKKFEIMQPTTRSFFSKHLTWMRTFFTGVQHSLKIEKAVLSQIKPPYVLLCVNQSDLDYAVVEQAIFPKNLNHITQVSQFAKQEPLMIRMGYLPLRRYVADSSLIYQIKAVLIQGKAAVLYPEAHQSFDGTSSPLPDLLYHVLKNINVPVLMLKVHGSYLSKPCWGTVDHKTPIEATVVRLMTASETMNLEPESIGARLLTAFRYDEYWWMLQNSVQLTSPQRAEGLHYILYHCPVCHTEFQMASKGDRLWCERCKQEWVMSEVANLTMVEDSVNLEILEELHGQAQRLAQEAFDRERSRQAAVEYGNAKRAAERSRIQLEEEISARQKMVLDAKLSLQAPPEFGPLPPLLQTPPPPGPLPPLEAPPIEIEEIPDLSRIPSWLAYEREKVCRELESGEYSLDLPVTIERMRSVRDGFVPIGSGHLRHDSSGVVLYYTGLDGKPTGILENSIALHSLHVGFNFQNRGQYIDFSTKDDTYYLYPAIPEYSVTKLALAVEETYKGARRILNGDDI